MNFKKISLLVIVAVSLASIQTMARFKYEGVARCAFCHKKENIGNQYGVWKKNPHAKAFESLGTPEAKKLAAKEGVSGNPQQAKECLICHASSQYDQNGKKHSPLKFKRKFKIEEGVQCEDCHGPGEKYWKKKTMKLITKEGGAAVSPTAKKTGLIFPDEKVCKRCHVPEIAIGGVTFNNPTYKGFDHKKRAAEIAHPMP